MKRYAYTYPAGSVVFQGNCSSIQEAKCEAIEDFDLKKGDKLTIGEYIPAKMQDFFFDFAESIIDDMEEVVACEYADTEWLVDVTEEELDELRKYLNPIVEVILGSWLKKYQYGPDPHFGRVHNTKDYTIAKADMEAMQAWKKKKEGAAN